MLWRQAQLCLPHGLFLVSEGIYQIRGLDASNMTIVEGDQGIIVIDALMSIETAAEGMQLYRRHRGNREVTAIIYTHPHGDHYGGARGVLPEEKPMVPIYAPKDFMFHAVSENVIAGPPMGRRSGFQFGGRLEIGPKGHVACGTCLGTSKGSRELIPPNKDIIKTGQEEVIDGVRFLFQMTPGTEAPAEMNFLIPDRRALCISENASQSLHNITALRGSQVRDAQAWSEYLDEAIVLFTEDVEVCFGGHNWPTWGKESVVRFLSEQRDLYAYLHNQTVLMMSQGLTGTEIAEELTLPEGLQTAWHAQSFYGSLNQNVKSIYQRYMGWYDGNPAHLWEYPPVQLAERYVACMGGIDETVRKASEFVDRGDLRFAVALLNHAVFSQPAHTEAKERLACVYEQLAWCSMCAPWRDSYLVAALELRKGSPKAAPAQISGGVLVAANVDQILSSLAVRIDGLRAQHETIAVDLDITDSNENYRIFLSNGALIRRKNSPANRRDGTAACSLTKGQLLTTLSTGRLPQEVERMEEDGIEKLRLIVSFIRLPVAGFNIVTP
ncbi:Alkyl/aryl-sulfatase BDS1 [Penicillium canescens]|uniref:Alkyl/aryl-sulfatase BDS1 n=2 Tax=Penicillium canescens TaxID=5083 RepID=A0AAD6N7B4_PENCN|nr:Alkyl/aryl-sulfatase BDS1 [Penicillium canescens]KAJ6038104.1 Alkyl/aryl-sulfatase BDS1 [Penicillium canescens]KAJ6174921.1 Alkyl/aryl-sulfatase BDS1 [Penicillium canescens]